MLTVASLTTQLTQAHTHSQRLAQDLTTAQTAHATAEVNTSEANDALELIAHRARKHKKRRGGGELETRHRMVLAAHNRMQAREVKACRVVKRTQLRLKVAKDRVSRLEVLNVNASETQLPSLEAVLGRWRPGAVVEAKA